MSAAIFYIYILFRLDGSPCYIGKGKGKRIDRHKYGNNPHLTRIIAQAGGELPRVKIRENLAESEAFELERIFIAAIGREAHGGPLVNLTDGGEGPSGHQRTPEMIERVASKNRGQKRTPEVCRAISLSKIGKPRFDLRGKALAPEHRAKIGRPGIKKGPISPEARLRLGPIRSAAKRNPCKPSTKAAISAAWDGPGIREARIAGLKAGWARRRARLAAAQEVLPL